MLPVVSAMANRLDPAVIGDKRIPRNWRLRQPVVALAREISRDRSVLYMFSETWAGPGVPEAIASRHDVFLYGPSGTCGDTEGDLQPGCLAPRAPQPSDPQGRRSQRWAACHRRTRRRWPR